MSVACPTCACCVWCSAWCLSPVQLVRVVSGVLPGVCRLSNLCVLCLVFCLVSVTCPTCACCRWPGVACLVSFAWCRLPKVRRLPGAFSVGFCVCAFLNKIILYTLLSLSGNSGRLTWVWLQQPQDKRYPVLQVRIKKQQHCFIPFGKFGPTYLGMAAAAARAALLSPTSVYAGSFRVFVIHRNLTWTTGSLTCVRDHSYACVYIYIHTGVRHCDF